MINTTYITLSRYTVSL